MGAGGGGMSIMSPTQVVIVLSPSWPLAVAALESGFDAQAGQSLSLPTY